MRMRRIAVALAAAGALGVTAVLPAVAQDPGDTPTEEARPPAEERRAERRAAFAAALAEELGIDQERVEEALEAVRERFAAERREARLAALREHLDEAVADGDLTQEQADAIYEAAEAGVLPLGGFRGAGRHPGRGFGPPHGVPPTDDLGAEAGSA